MGDRNNETDGRRGRGATGRNAAIRGGHGEEDREPWRRERYGSRLDQDRDDYGSGYDAAADDYGSGLERPAQRSATSEG